MSVKLYNKTAFKTTMKRVWNNIKVEFIEAGDNLFLIQFNKMLDKNRVLEDESWSFDNQLVLLKDYDVKKGLMQYGAWMRALMGKGLKNIAGLNVGEDKFPTVEKVKLLRLVNKIHWGRISKMG
ncbi:unnamed protein product [Ilex paraguariensis]|uniref:DUF4283 domain-containing protein n=1 Tax=Ilex paraguariensis TaxID=185542 RepID=A0ABC8RZJ5_9AQUA